MFKNHANNTTPRKTFGAPLLGPEPTLAQAEEMADHEYTNWVLGMDTYKFNACRDGIKTNLEEQKRLIGRKYVELSRATSRRNRDITSPEAQLAWEKVRGEMEYLVGWYENWEMELAKLYTARWHTTEELNDWAYQANREAGRHGQDDGGAQARDTKEILELLEGNPWEQKG